MRLLTLLLVRPSEHRCGWGRFLWRSGLRGQHEGSSDQVGPDGDDCLRSHFLHCWARVLGNLPGELRRGRPHHDLLRGPQPQSSWSFREDKEGESLDFQILFFWEKETCPGHSEQVRFSRQSWWLCVCLLKTEHGDTRQNWSYMVE